MIGSAVSGKLFSTGITEALVIVLALLSFPAWGHGEYDWIRKGGYIGPNGSPCCGEDDCYKIRRDEVSLQDGVFHLPKWRLTVPVKDALVSEDEHYWLCMNWDELRCMFSPMRGM